MGAAVGAAAAAWLAASTTPRLFGWVACPVVATALVCGSVYSWLRLPFWLGWLASELITRLAMHGYPLRLRSLRLRPWLELRPLERRRSATLHVDLFVTHFYLANPPGCKAPHFVSADEVLTLTLTLTLTLALTPTPALTLTLTLTLAPTLTPGARGGLGRAQLPQAGRRARLRLLRARARQLQHARGARGRAQLHDV